MAAEMAVGVEMKSRNPETKIYPIACTSAFCGRLDCPADCPNLPALTDFKEWSERTDAVQADPIWDRLVYEARR